MLDIPAGMDQKDSCPRRTGYWFFLGDDFYEFLYSARSLVRWWIHALRLSTVLVKQLTYFQVCLRIQRSAWFNSGYMRCVSLRGFLEESWGCPDSVENCGDSACVLGHGC